MVFEDRWCLGELLTPLERDDRRHLRELLTPLEEVGSMRAVLLPF